MLPQTRVSLHLHLQNWDFVAGSGAAEAVCHHPSDMPPWCRDLVPYQEAKTPLSQAVQLLGSRFDHHSRGNCLGGAVVGIVKPLSAVPSAALTPSLRNSQIPLFQKWQLIHHSLQKPLTWKSLEYHVQIISKVKHLEKKWLPENLASSKH